MANHVISILHIAREFNGMIEIAEEIEYGEGSSTLDFNNL